MNKKTEIPSNIEYLGQFITELPHNAILDKGKVGCGGTTIAIENKDPYIICVPFTELIVNKISQYPNDRYDGEIYGFYSGNNLKRDLVSYLERVEVPKIIVTYDSLLKLSRWINIEEYKILIDELHLLFTEYSYRSKAVKEVLSIYDKFKSYCFMTATPLEEEFILEEIKHLPTEEITWENTQMVTVHSIRVNGKTRDTVIDLINRFLNNEYTQNAYFFINSVEYIKQIVTSCGLNESNTRVIYSSSNRTDVGIKRGSSLDKPKRINFITSTAFEGADFYDENGITFIVSDSSKSHTLTDISTKFQQIAGRIRDSKYSDTIYHIYKETRYSELSYKEYKEYINQTIEDTKDFVNNNTGKDYVKRFKDEIFDLFYLQREGVNLLFDPNKLKIDLYNFKITRNIYSLRINLIREYEKNNYQVKSIDLNQQIMNTITNPKSERFNDVVDKLKKFSSQGDKYQLPSEYVNNAYKKYPFLEEAIEKLGFKEIERMKYNITNIKEKLIVMSDVGLEATIIKALNNRFKPVNGDFVTSKEINSKLSHIYKELDIQKTVKSTDINKYYNVKPTSRRIDGRVTKGYIILGKKIIR